MILNFFRRGGDVVILMFLPLIVFLYNFQILKDEKNFYQNLFFLFVLLTISIINYIKK